MPDTESVSTVHIMYPEVETNTVQAREKWNIPNYVKAEIKQFQRFQRSLYIAIK